MQASSYWRAVVAVALVATLSGVSSSAASMNGPDRLSQLTRAFAALDARDMSGRHWTAEGLRGRVVVLDFWATWCPPCWKELPWLRKIHNGWDPTRVQVIGVTLDVTDRRTLVAWLNRQRVDWPQIWESHGYDSTLAERFGVGSLPTTLLVAADGRVVAANLRGARLVAAVETLLTNGGAAGATRAPLRLEGAEGPATPLSRTVGQKRCPYGRDQPVANFLPRRSAEHRRY